MKKNCTWKDIQALEQEDFSVENVKLPYLEGCGLNTGQKRTILVFLSSFK